MTDSRRPVAVAEDIITRARNGDDRCFGALFAAYQPHLLRHLELTCGSRSEDVAAATWASVVKSIDSFRGDGDCFRRWLFTIARRRLVDDLRRTSREPVVVNEPENVDLGVDFTSPLESIQWVEDALKQLPVRQAEVISLRIVGGLSTHEVADLLEISAENVRVLSHRGLNTLRARYERASESFTQKEIRQQTVTRRP